VTASTQSTLDDLVVSGKVVAAADLASLTTYKFGGPARWFAEVGTCDELAAVLDARRASGDPDVIVLGRGSNLLISDAGIDGLVIRLGGSFLDITIGGDGVVAAGGAVPLPVLARTVTKAGRGGLEWYVGIPGSVGGAVCMNAGGHGSDTSEWIIGASVMDVRTGTVRTIDAVALGLGYRRSAIRSNDIVLGARFRTIPRGVEEGERILREITQWRKEHQPGGTFNAGSVFRNPPGDAAGRIIDALGLKGYRIGGASVSLRHANFFEAGESATAQDVYDLVWSVRARVLHATGIELVPEIRFAGSFRSSADEPAGGEG
jgi:UDP-N-acetylmuramate dehydrogenase